MSLSLTGAYLSKVGETCEFKGLPFIAEAEYPNAYQSLGEMSQSFGPEYLKRNARLCAELGADIVKVNWSGDQKSFGEIIRACDRPVVLAGGALISDADLLTRMQQARAVGAVGCSVGRNVFQHKNRPPSPPPSAASFGTSGRPGKPWRNWGPDWPGGLKLCPGDVGQRRSAYWTIPNASFRRLIIDSA